MSLLRSRALLFLAFGSLAFGSAPLFAQPGRGGGRAGNGRGPVADPFRFTLLGPATGGRVASIVGVPGDFKTWYVGAASGGIWKSNDSGFSFSPVFDSMDVQSIGALAISTADHAQIWAGTGEAWAIRDADIAGDGIYKSTDSGATWHNMGLHDVGRIGRIIVHPTNPNIVYVCALGFATGPEEERGVYKTTDGGKTWKHVLFVDQNTGCSGLTLDTKNPNVLFAGMWQVVLHTWAMYSGGPSTGIWTSHDAGESWTKVVDTGLPHDSIGKIDVAVAPSNSQRVYALIQTADKGSVWRSDDGGKQWKVVNWSRQLIGRAGYYIRLGVNPQNADEVLIANSSFFQSTDGGKTFNSVPWGGDNHDIWFDPKNGNHFGLTDDAGARITTDHGKTFGNVNLPIAQAYHVAVDTQVPYWIYTNRQDNSTMRGPSSGPEAGPGGRGLAVGIAGGRGRGGGGGGAGRGNDTTAGRAARGQVIAQSGNQRPTTNSQQPTTNNQAPAEGARGGRGTAPADTTPTDFFGGGGRGGADAPVTWEHAIGGCESGFTLPDLDDHNIVWASCYGDEVTRYDDRTHRARSVSPWIHTLDSPPNDTKYRCHWTPPLAIDPFDQKTVYYGCQVIFKTSNAGQSWSVISPDLSTQDPSRIVSSGGLVGDNLGQFYGELVFSIAPSEIQRGLIWAGTNDGKVWNTQDGGANWNDVTANLHMPPWGTVRKIEPGHFDPGTAYVVVDYHMNDDRHPFLYKTTDFGKTWTSIVSDLPKDHPLDYLMSVAENPNKKGMLFAGSAHAFYVSMDDGAHWTHWQNGLPQAPVSWIVVQKTFNDVVVSTYGRGIYVLRDIAPLENGMLAEGENAKLYAPHPGYRQDRSGRADITFALRQPGQTKVEILDSTGAVIRTLPNAPTRAGLNRVTWNLQYDPPKRIDLRTTPAENPNIWDEPRFRNRNVRPVTHWGIQGQQASGPLAAPGHYSVRLTAAGQTLTQPFTVLLDHEVPSPVADLVASTQAQIKARDALNATADMVNKIETTRKQLQDEMKANADKPEIKAQLEAFDKKMLDVEYLFLTKSDMLSDDKYYIDTPHLYINLIWLYGEIGPGGGDVAGGPDYRPTDTSIQWLDRLEQELSTDSAKFKQLMDVDLPAFNKAMAGKIATIADR